MREPLTDAERADLAAAHPDWAVGETSMTRTVVLGDFKEAMGFTVRVALAAEVLDHHPDIDIRWNKVTLVLSTHSAGALTGLDRSLAETIDGYLA